MALVPAKCPNCGGSIKVDASGKAGLCEYCNTPFIVQEAINNYNIVNNIGTQIINVTNVIDSEFESLLRDYNTARELGGKFSAVKMLKLVIGGSASGKSEYAEELIISLAGDENIDYIAPMKAYDEESVKRIDAHRIRRFGKSFVTMEKPVRVAEIAGQEHSRFGAAHSAALGEEFHKLQ